MWRVNAVAALSFAISTCAAARQFSGETRRNARDNRDAHPIRRYHQEASQRDVYYIKRTRSEKTSNSALGERGFVLEDVDSRADRPFLNTWRSMAPRISKARTHDYLESSVWFGPNERLHRHDETVYMSSPHSAGVVIRLPHSGHWSPG